MPPLVTIVTVSLNPAIDRVLEVPNFTLGQHQVGTEVRRTPAGKAVNVSRVLAALDVPSIATGFLGKENRDAFDEVFDDPHISDEFFMLPGRTRENVTISDPNAAQETHVRQTGLSVSPEALERLRRKLVLLARQDSVMIFSGSLPPGVTPGAFAQIIGELASQKVKVAVDTTGEALASVAHKTLWLVKPNSSELALLVGRKLGDISDHLAAAAELATNIHHVLYSRGAEGAYLFCGSTALHAFAPIDRERVRNTVGCGDTLVASFVAAICHGRSPEDALARAVATATASACDFGTASFDPILAEELLANVELKRL